MKPYVEMSKEELTAEYEALKASYQAYVDRHLSLNMARGKPGSDQLDLSRGMLDVINSASDLTASDGTDARNYGCLDGLPEAKKLLGDMMDSDPEDVIVYGNSSLNIMYDQIARSYTFGVMGNTPWCQLDGPVKWLCPVPGYDRHFGITEFFGIEMINIPMHEDGPDMDAVEAFVKDPAVKGIWCVPKYSNPGGVVYSDEVIDRFAHLQPAAKDFRIYWDNAYCIHHLYEEIDIPDILKACKEAGHPDLVYKFGSTSKITFPGAGIAALATSPNNKKDILNQMKHQTIGHDKLNQLRHVRFFGDLNGLKEHMKKHADLIRPKFEAVEKTLNEQLGGLEVGTWTNPKGGYFISFTGLDGTAQEIVAKMKEAGVVMTGAGATYPYHKDPHDSNIRIAPTLPPLDEIALAAEIFATVVKLVSAEKLLAQK
ncbi:aminotransferase class I/II-fold pyridoxal phosphate-dependent enzyme [Intestinibaculum porci]|uniref:aminotransferase class I/II-fold pyridoxal phosphate-dependent enzyme n=1 Tax=Intestinibaculum porci TaxID=2487118 RepID=UPI00240A2B70|nr:aminotransferase class I/II-fold pyridoxal phosphate-dependent enzyme [Intestinibaculum porci]MDD6349454.1 aminotransferase class I/II-fold pyridoxal phosphate-dependent enzyme [Intestinibaculum porci]MDD6422813.1 aminotransferase class I/II-fold pyridoxal phosphate-dependent enzyme [Intestinibaculum porci]